MEKNTLLAIVLSTAFLILWWSFYPQQKLIRNQTQAVSVEQISGDMQNSVKSGLTIPEAVSSFKETEEKEIIVKTKNYYAVFTTKGASIKHWLIKEKTGKEVDLVLPESGNLFSTYDNLNYQIIKNTNNEIVFLALLPDNKKITKTYNLSDKYIHNLKIETNLPFSLTLASGLGTDAEDLKDNTKLTRAIAMPVNIEKLENLKPAEYPFSAYKWVAVDNRYFLNAVIPQSKDTFDKILAKKENKKAPPTLVLYKDMPLKGSIAPILLKIYLGPKEIASLKEVDMNFESTIDFGMFGFLSKIALKILNFFYGLTSNFGWSIILLTMVIQVLVFPLTIKSFKAQAAMKKLNPFIKEIQEKYKNDPKRLNMEMLNVYKTQKVNPLGGCLPMLLQIPIFWALFNALRNTYELRGAPWIFWVKDLSLHDPYYILPIVMGIGMLFQQKMVSVTADPTQAKMMYLMPVIFTFMFLNFPAGLVLYWLTNSIISMIEQYFIMARQQEVA
jgi:YidC/Oxa1 family membrane protein insertase